MEELMQNQKECDIMKPTGKVHAYVCGRCFIKMVNSAERINGYV